MKLFKFNFQPVILTVCLICASACTSQVSKKNNPQSESITDNHLLGSDGSNNGLRVDSVLQFSLMITDIFQDSKDNYWFGTHGDGLCRYDGTKYTYYTVENGLPLGVDREFAPGLDWSETRKINGGNQIQTIQEDMNGIIWVNTMDNLCKFNGQTFDAVRPDNHGHLKTNKSKKEWDKEKEYMWIGAGILGVYRYDGNTLELLKFPPNYFRNNNDAVSELYKDKEGNLWLGTMDSGTFRYDGKSFEPINMDNQIGICRSIFQDNTGRLWITNNRYDLYFMEGDSLTNFIKDYKLRNPIDALAEEFDTGYQTIEQDENGDLWFGTFGGGLWRYDGEKLMHYTVENLIQSDLVKTIFKDKHGKLWYGIGEGTVYGFNGKSFYRFDDKNI